LDEISPSPPLLPLSFCPLPPLEGGEGKIQRGEIQSLKTRKKVLEITKIFFGVSVGFAPSPPFPLPSLPRLSFPPQGGKGKTPDSRNP